MKTLTILIGTTMLLTWPFGVASADTTGPAIQLEASHWNETNAEDHLKAAENFEEKLTTLEDEVRRMAEKFGEYNRKPYLDTKGLRRDSLKRIIGSTMKEIEDLRERITWHRTKASRLANARESVPDSKSNDGQKMSEEGETSSS